MMLVSGGTSKPERGQPVQAGSGKLQPDKQCGQSRADPAAGAGKTTLMDVLAGRKTGGRIQGDVRLNGHPKVQDTFARVSGYVEQTGVDAAWLHTQPWRTRMHQMGRAHAACLRISGVQGCEQAWRSWPCLRGLMTRACRTAPSATRLGKLCVPLLQTPATPINWPHSTVRHTPGQAECAPAADIHDPFTTVHEALRFSAHLRINGGPDNATVEQFVEEVMGLVELGPLRSLPPPHLVLGVCVLGHSCAVRAKPGWAAC